MTKQNFWNAETEVFELQEVYPPEEGAAAQHDALMAILRLVPDEARTFKFTTEVESTLISLVREAERVAVEREREEIIDTAKKLDVAIVTSDYDEGYTDGVEMVVAAIRARGDKQDG